MRRTSGQPVRSSAVRSAGLATVLVATAGLLAGATPVAARPANDLTAQSRAPVASPVPVLSGTLEVRAEQHRRGGGSGGGSGGGQAVPRGGSASGGDSSGGTRSGGGAVTRGSGSDGSTGRTRARTDSNSGDSGGTAVAGTGSRAREGRPVTGTAVERRDGGDSRGGTTIIVGGGYYGGYYPWGWGGLGLGGYYGWYDPWGYDPYPPSGYGYGYYAEGGLKLKVSPRQAEVFVDGYFAGAVDDYDGLFQRLRLEPGPHRIEIRLDGYEPLSFEVRILPDRTITYKGELKRVD